MMKRMRKRNLPEIESGNHGFKGKRRRTKEETNNQVLRTRPKEGKNGVTT
jgi:hypothetical protein